MEDRRKWLSCEECEGEFSVETDCDMDILYCVFCGEPLDTTNWEDDNDIFEDSV